MFLDNPLRPLRPARASANFCSGQLSVAQLVERGTVIAPAAAIPRSVVRVHPGRPFFSLTLLWQNNVPRVLGSNTSTSPLV